MKARTLSVVVLLLVVVVSSAAAQGTSGAASVPPASPPPAAFVSVDTAAGFPLDPFFVSLRAGGKVAAKDLTKLEACSGWVADAPTATFLWDSKNELLKTFFVSDANPVLVVQLPDGSFMCNDDANRLLLDPSIEIDAPASGRYNVWAGSRAERQLIPGILVVTTKAGINLGTFRLAELVKRQPVPEQLPAAPIDSVLHDKLAAVLAQAKPQSDLKPGSAPVTQPVTADGDLPAVRASRGKLECNGFVKLQPSYVFSWTGPTKNLRLFFEGDKDAALFVMQPDGTVVCNDDADGAPSIDGVRNANPLLDLPNPVAGNYAVWVGRVDFHQPVSGTLTIAEGTGAKPKALPGSSLSGTTR